MNTLQLKYFMEFAFYGSAEKAAVQMGVSRSSVSRNIKKLEEELNTQLFTATMQGIVLTREGDLCLRYARRLLKIDDDLRFDIAGYGKYHGKIDIAMGTSRSQDILMFVLPEFSRRYPNVSVQIHEMCTNDIYNWLLNQRLDFAIVSQRDVPQGFSCEYLMTERLVLVAPRGDAFARACSYQRHGTLYVDLTAFREQPFILGYGTQKSRSVSDRIFKMAGFEPHIILQTSNNFNAATLAYNGLAYTLVPESSAVRKNNVMEHYRLEPEEQVSWSIGLTSLDKNPVSHVARQLQLLIREMLGDEKKGQWEDK